MSKSEKENKLPGRPKSSKKNEEYLVSARMTGDLHKTLLLWADVDGCSVGDVIEKCVVPHVPALRKKISNHFKRLKAYDNEEEINEEEINVEGIEVEVIESKQRVESEVEVA